MERRKERRNEHTEPEKARGRVEKGEERKKKERRKRSTIGEVVSNLTARLASEKERRKERS